MNSFSRPLSFSATKLDLLDLDVSTKPTDVHLDNGARTFVSRDHLPKSNLQPKPSLNKAAFSDLSAIDQASFRSFSQGPNVKPAFNTLHAAVEYWALQQPETIAAEYEGQQISYWQLNLQADALALKLLRMGVEAGDKVGLFVKRSIDMLVGMLAVLKTGAAYVPLDIGICPASQMASIIKIAQLRVVISFARCVSNIPDAANLKILAVDAYLQGAVQADLALINTQNLKAEHLSETVDLTRTVTNQCAFVLFTSGTTGTPNGVQVSHKNLCNILLTTPGNMTIKPGVKVSQILNIAFDMSAWEIWGALCNGGSLVIRGESITETVAKVDVVIATPSILDRIPLDQVQPIKAVAVAGEPCPRPLADIWANACAFYNSCGPTETTIINTAQRHFAESALLSIGSPTPNNTVYILDETLTPCAIGDTGEMWAGGDCVTLGYIGNPQLTRARYLPDPFLGGEHLMFRTRDLGRWTKDGQLEHLGRTDDQVKIRGFRVELDAVSNLLERQQHCCRAVTLKLDSRDLVAFVMPADIDTTAARQALAKRLPYYSVPKHIIALERLPLTDRGKVDKGLLQQQYFTQLLSQIVIEDFAQPAISASDTAQMERSLCR